MWMRRSAENGYRFGKCVFGNERRVFGGTISLIDLEVIHIPHSPIPHFHENFRMHLDVYPQFAYLVIESSQHV